MRLFGTNGVRGVANDDMTVELAQKLGRSVATLVGPGSTSCVGSDARVSSDALKAALASGLMAGGVDVTDLGMVPTPTVHHAAVGGGHDVGLVVTASHNPPEFNGIKVVDADGTELPKDKEAQVEDAYFEEDWTDVAWDQVGTLDRDPRATDRYVDAVASQVDADAIRNAGLDVAIDCGNGAGARTTPDLLARLDVDYLALNAHPDGRFPGHPSEPSPENARDLMDAVPRRGADLGAILDGDADRCIFVDGDGTYVPGERMLAVLAADAVERNGGGVVVTPVSTSRAVEEMVDRAGGEIRYTAVGSPIVNRTIREIDGLFGGEENGGFVFPSHQVCRDALMTLAAGLDIVARTGRSLADLLSDVPAYHTVKRKVACPEDRKDDVLDRLHDKVVEEHDDVDTTDGVKVPFDDGWVLVRPSGTEPLFRVFAEARDRDVAETRAEEWTGEVGALVEVDA